MPSEGRRRRVYRSKAARRRRSLVAVVLLVAITVALVVAGTSGGRDRVTYDRAAAVAYADTWAKSVNPDFWSSKDRDCANFVSQCVSAGGLRPLYETGAVWHDNGSELPAVSWVNCGRQKHVWSAASASHAPSYIVTSTSSQPASWDVGDVVYLGNTVAGKTEWQHVIICVGKKDGHWVYDSHTKAYHHRPLETWYPAHFSLIRYCHMADAVSYD